MVLCGFLIPGSDSSYKLLIRRPCGSLALCCWLVECTRNWVWFQHANECNLPHFWGGWVGGWGLGGWVGVGWSWYFSFISGCVLLLNLKVAFGINWSLAVLLCFSLWGKHNGHSWGLWCGIVLVTFWLADAAWVTDSLELSRCMYVGWACHKDSDGWITDCAMWLY